MGREGNKLLTQCAYHLRRSSVPRSLTAFCPTLLWALDYGLLWVLDTLIGQLSWLECLELSQPLSAMPHSPCERYAAEIGELHYTSRGLQHPPLVQRAYRCTRCARYHSTASSVFAGSQPRIRYRAHNPRTRREKNNRWAIIEASRPR